MNRLFVLALVLAPLVSTVTGCEDNNECKRLKAILQQTKTTAENAGMRAETYERIKDNETRAKKKANQVMDSLGLDDAEDDLEKTIEERRSKLIGSTIKRHPRKPDPESGAFRRQSTLWSVTFTASSVADAIAKAKKLVETPPLFYLERLVRSQDKKNEWRVDLGRATIDRVPIKPTRVKIIMPTDPADVPSEFGFCGSGALRSKIGALRAEIESVRDDAEKTSMIMPASASWRGIEKRSRLVEAIEKEYRVLLDVFFKTVVEQKLNVVVRVRFDVLGGCYDRGPQTEPCRRRRGPPGTLGTRAADGDQRRSAVHTGRTQGPSKAVAGGPLRAGAGMVAHT